MKFGLITALRMIIDLYLPVQANIRYATYRPITTQENDVISCQAEKSSHLSPSDSDAKSRNRKVGSKKSKHQNKRGTVSASVIHFVYASVYELFFVLSSRQNDRTGQLLVTTGHLQEHPVVNVYTCKNVAF